MRKTEIAGAKFPLIALFRFSFHTTFVHHTFLHEVKRDARRKGDSDNSHNDNNNNNGGEEGYDKRKRSRRQSHVVAKGEEIHLILTKPELDAMYSGAVQGKMIPDDLKVTCVFTEEPRRREGSFIGKALDLSGVGGSLVRGVVDGQREGVEERGGIGRGGAPLYLGGESHEDDEEFVSLRVSNSRIQKVALSRPNNSNNFNNFKTLQTKSITKTTTTGHKNRNPPPHLQRKAMSERGFSAHRFQNNGMSKSVDNIPSHPVGVTGGTPTEVRPRREETLSSSRKFSDGALERGRRYSPDVSIGQSRSSNKVRTRRVYMVSVSPLLPQPPQPTPHHITPQLNILYFFRILIKRRRSLPHPGINV